MCKIAINHNVFVTVPILAKWLHPHRPHSGYNDRFPDANNLTLHKQATFHYTEKNACVRECRQRCTNKYEKVSPPAKQSRTSCAEAPRTLRRNVNYVINNTGNKSSGGYKMGIDIKVAA